MKKLNYDDIFYLLRFQVNQRMLVSIIGIYYRKDCLHIIIYGYRSERLAGFMF